MTSAELEQQRETLASIHRQVNELQRIPTEQRHNDHPECYEPFRLERAPASGGRQLSEFPNNSKADGSPLSQMVLFSGSQACVAGQQDLFDLTGERR